MAKLPNTNIDHTHLIPSDWVQKWLPFNVVAKVRIIIIPTERNVANSVANLLRQRV